MSEDEPEIVEERVPSWEIFEQDFGAGIQDLRTHRGDLGSVAGKQIRSQLETRTGLWEIRHHAPPLSPATLEARILSPSEPGLS